VGRQQIKKFNKPAIVSEIDAILSLDLYISEFSSIDTAVHRLSSEKRNNLLVLCEKIINDAKLYGNVKVRVATAKLTVALIPLSLNLISRIIRTKKNKFIHEVHFSLFCFLDNVIHSSEKQKYSGEIVLLVREYLMDIKTNSGSAAWMAGDLLGGHWEITEGVSTLIEVAQEARFVAGRWSAVVGLGASLRRLDKPNLTEKKIVSVLRKIAENDRSKQVRLASRMILDENP